MRVWSINKTFFLQKILEEYKKDGHQFLLKVFESSKYLEDLSGITDLLTAQHDEASINSNVIHANNTNIYFRAGPGIQRFRFRIVGLNATN